MATSSERRDYRKLQAENKRLIAKNEELRRKLTIQVAPKPVRQGTKQTFRKIGIILCVGLATAMLVVGNLLFWTGSTIVNTDRYVAATAPLIKNPQIQDALAASITQKLFASVNVDQVIQEALPPRANFLAPTLTDQVKQHTDDAVKKILQRPQFQNRWNTAQERAHQRFITLVDKYGSNGSINISEIYNAVSQQLKGTKLGFLADKPLPSKVGNIQLVSGSWLSILQRTIQHIDIWRVIAILLLVIFSFLGVWLSRNRRKTVVALGSLFAAGMFITILSIRLGREIVANRVEPQYADAASQAYAIIAHPLVVQTFTLLVAALAVVLIAWLSGSSASSKAVKARIEQLLSGKLHSALFPHENSFTKWLGRHKRLLQWLVIALVACTILFVRLTPAVLLVQLVIILLVVVLTEILAENPKRTSQDMV